jgi:hypothetical protein
MSCGGTMCRVVKRNLLAREYVRIGRNGTDAEP